MNDSGLLEAGYEYFCLDGMSCNFRGADEEDCWMAANRSKKGDLLPDLERFPSGMKALGERIHSMGMKFGIYESAGVITCQHLPGSLGTLLSKTSSIAGYEYQDAKLFASWGTPSDIIY